MQVSLDEGRVGRGQNIIGQNVRNGCKTGNTMLKKTLPYYVEKYYILFEILQPKIISVDSKGMYLECHFPSATITTKKKMRGMYILSRTVVTSFKDTKRKLTITVSWGFNNNCFGVVVFLQYTHTISLRKWDKIPLSTLLIVNNFKSKRIETCVINDRSIQTLVFRLTLRSGKTYVISDSSTQTLVFRLTLRTGKTYVISDSSTQTLFFRLNLRTRKTYVISDSSTQTLVFRLTLRTGYVGTGR